ncbi:uncharacterized protein LOC143377483 [Andrena cerasifolii]|uniref:uncharacterized protein LOC143377483 n=1 Tax=Andrena cerasifolii TaxID=2819439 RepID=UPI00403765E9
MNAIISLVSFRENCPSAATIKLVESWGVDYDIAIDCLPPLLTTGVVMAKYFNGVFHVSKLAELCYMVKSDSERLKDLPQFEVLHYHALQGRRFVVSFTIALSLLLAIYLSLPTALIVHDILTKNESEEKYVMYQADYYIVDTREHYYFETVHSYVASIMMIFLICTLDSMFIIFIQHACAMFAVTGYQLKTVDILDTNTMPVGTNKAEYQKFENAQELMYAKLILCVKEHQRAIECTRIVQSAFSVALFLEVTMNILTLSITGIQALLTMSSGNISDLLRLTTWMMGQYIHLVFIHFPGQRLSNFSEQVYYDSLECKWHTTFHKSRVVYQFFVMNTLVPCQLTALKVTTLNLETLLSVCNTLVRVNRSEKCKIMCIIRGAFRKDVTHFVHFYDSSTAFMFSVVKILKTARASPFSFSSRKLHSRISPFCHHRYSRR